MLQRFQGAGKTDQGAKRACRGIKKGALKMIQSEMLEYQTIDRELSRIEKELRKTNTTSSANNTNRYVKAARKVLQNSTPNRRICAVSLLPRAKVYKRSTKPWTTTARKLRTSRTRTNLIILRKAQRGVGISFRFGTRLKTYCARGEEIVKSLDEINAKLPKNNGIVRQVQRRI